MNAILRSKSHPDYGSIAVGFPIPDEHYDPLMETLRQLGMGGTTEQDCTVERIDGGLPILKRLEGQNVNIDELDCLARQTQQFSQRDAARYQAKAFAHGFYSMDDLLNLSPAVNFQKMTVIRDFASLENDGLAHYKTLHPFASAKELEGIDGVEAAMDLILNDRGGRITPYGVAYDFNQELKQIYDPGGPLPPLNDHEGVMELSVFSPEHGRDHPISFVRLPTSEPRLERLLERGGISPRSDLSIGVACIGCDLRQLPEDFDHTSPQDFNRLAKRIAALSPEDNTCQIHLPLCQEYQGMSRNCAGDEIHRRQRILRGTKDRHRQSERRVHDKPVCRNCPKRKRKYLRKSAVGCESPNAERVLSSSVPAFWL